MSRPRVAFAGLLALITGLALALRLWYVLALPDQGKDLIFSDMRTYDYTAWQFVRGLPVTGEPGLNGYHPLSASTYYYIGYTYFVAALYAAFGHDPAVVRVAQAVVGALSVGAVGLLGSLCFGRRQGLVAALLTTVYLPLVYYAGLLLTETWFSFVQLAALVLWLLAWDVLARPEDETGTAATSRRWRLGAGAGLAWLAGVLGGVASLTRPTFVLSLATLAAGGWCFAPRPVPRRLRVLLIAALSLGGTLVIAPITVRNYQIHGRFYLITTNLPSTFLTGHITHFTDLPPDIPPGTTDAALADRHRRVIDTYFAEHWRDYLAEIPEFFQVIWTDSAFWPSTSTYWIQNPPPARSRMAIQVFRDGSPSFGRLDYFPDLLRYNDRLVWGLLGLPAGLLAVLFLPRGDRRWSVLYLALIPYLLVPFLASAFSRFRLPATPLLFILAAQALVASWDSRSRRSARREDPASAREATAGPA
jgi:4-amino-4-deoxy-L-arabinose transferase-like glycosyltransferase